jgi:Fur family ferric uptake transcriptional regulator
MIRASKNSDGRQTMQARVLAAVISQSAAPLSIHELLEAAKTEVPGLGIATVYRNIARMLAAGEINAVVIPGQPPRYERTGKPHHHYFYCEHCGRVFDLPGCVNGLRQMVPEGFRALRHDLTIYGACRNCESHPVEHL